MAEYIAPGVYVVEIPAGATPIEGVPTSTTGFVGRTNWPGRAIAVTATEAVAALFPHDAEGLLAQSLLLYFANGGQRAWVAGMATPDAAGVAAALTELARPPDVALTAVPEAATLPIGTHEAVIRIQLDDAARLRRFTIIDPPLNAQADDAHRLRTRFESSFGAMYWPAVVVDGKTTRVVPASGAVCGVYARVDQQRGVFHSPSSQAIAAVSRLAATPTAAELAALESAGINTIRSLPGMPPRLSSARTLSSSADLRYVSVRRYLLMLQNAIRQGTRWAIYERNDVPLWKELRARVAEFLRWQFLDGALMGAHAAEAFFVRCDETTTSVDDRAAGIVVCEIGVAPVRAGEFIVFRVAQSTARVGQ